MSIWDEDDTPSILPQGEILPDGIMIDETRDQGENFELYVSADGRFDILAARPALAERWVQEGYLQKRMLQIHCDDSGEIDCYLLISPSAQVLLRMTDARVYGHPYYAHVVASCIWHSRQKSTEVNLRDGILCELYSVVLPTYTLAPKIADTALFRNTLRGRFEAEDLRRDHEFDAGQSGLSQITFNEAMGAFNLPRDTITPYFQVGEYVDDFVQLAAHAIITGPLELRQEYQLFATDTDIVLVAFSQKWAEQLQEQGYLENASLKNVQIGRDIIKVLALSRRYAVENLSCRHFGISQADAFQLALNLSRALKHSKSHNLTEALYLQELNAVLPTKFNEFTQSPAAPAATAVLQAQQIIYDVLNHGPFAQGPFLDDVYQACCRIIES